MGKVDSEHRIARDWEQKGENALADHNDQKAADDFENAADALLRSADALYTKRDVKGSAHDLEAAGADMLKTNIDHRHRDAKARGCYGAAGDERMEAGKAAGRNHNEAAKQYGKAQEDFTKAKDAARNAGDTKNADKYGKQADDAGTKAYHARHLQFLHVLNGIAVRHDEKRTVQKAAEVRDASPAYNDPRNKL